MTDERDEKAREIVDRIQCQVDIDYGDAGDWCPDQTLQHIATALRAAAADTKQRERDRAERLLKRCRRFRESAQIHVQSLISREPSTPEWKAAVKWWEEVNMKIVLSDAPSPPATEQREG